MKINLLPKDQRPLRQSAVRWEFIVGMLGVLVLASVVLFSLLGTLTVNDLAAQEREAKLREERLLAEVQVVNGIRQDLTAAQNREDDYLDRMGAPSAVVRVLPALSDHSFSRLWIETLDWQDGAIEIVGYTEDTTSLSQYLYFLNEQSDDVVLRSINTQGNTGFRVFRVGVKGVDLDDSSELH